MALSTIDTTNQVDQWSAKFFQEYVRHNQFAPYMGTGTNEIIQVNEELGTKSGKSITCSLVTRLTGSGVTGNTALEGAEEALGNYGHEIGVSTRRNAVAVHTDDQQKTVIDILNAAEPQLQNWVREQLRDDVITALHSIDGTAYGSATEGAKDSWLAANSDRVLFGDAVGNGGYTDHSADLATVTAAMTLDTDIISLAKRSAKVADRNIRPYMTNDTRNSETFVLFCSSRAFRDLQQTTAMQQALREGWNRGRNNPIFSDGDLMWDGVVIREVPEIASVGAVGAASAAVDVAFLCGAQAIGVAYGQRPKAISETRDYGAVTGVGVTEIIGVDKLQYNSIDNGVYTIYVGAAADA